MPFAIRQSRTERDARREVIEPGLLGTAGVVCDLAVVALAQGCLLAEGLRGLPDSLLGSERDLATPTHGLCEHVLCWIPSLLCHLRRFIDDEWRGETAALRLCRT